MVEQNLLDTEIAQAQPQGKEKEGTCRDEQYRSSTPLQAQGSSPKSQVSSVFSSTRSTSSNWSSMSVGAINTPEFRRSPAPTPKLWTSAKEPQGNSTQCPPVTPSPLIRRSAAPSLSDYTHTLRSLSFDAHPSAHHRDGITSEGHSSGHAAVTADLVNGSDYRLSDDYTSLENRQYYPMGARSPAWSLLTASPVAPLPTIAEVPDEHVCRPPDPFPRGHSTAARAFNEGVVCEAESRRHNQNGKILDQESEAAESAIAEDVKLEPLLGGVQSCLGLLVRKQLSTLVISLA
ncbi:hypothetical protein CORC01_05639 [Colletotrichum orchidophilum]|uniref:Uncharacterized protein n=1 Tax=Colletotrichum orchidophilum TaxID=1209926 RepID=A0A1G4BCS1_9PEZI|nr:uncharacterized protein CORC01_05639 [Colletotrichum orchidophilum]OHE99146.1 hypothetical protein CORC01_05639 [Colletotrichum orchidophilum]